MASSTIAALWRTADLDEPGCRIPGRGAMADEVAEQMFPSAATPQLK